MISARNPTLLVLSAALLSAACHPAFEPTLVRIEGTTMGTTYNVIARAPADSGLSSAIEALLVEINDSVSTYIPESIISRINADDNPTRWHEIDPHFETIFRRSIEIHQDTAGRFNPAVGPLVDAWGFGPAGPSSLPTPAELSLLVALADPDTFEVRRSPPSVRKTVAGSALDLSAIAKGYAVDAIGGLLESRGVGNYFVEIGGEVRTRGRHPDGRLWRIGIEVPSEGPRHAMGVIEVGDAALATSGDYRNYIETDGRRITHIFDPSTGQPETTPIVSVSVLATDVMTADAYATALMLMGVDEGVAFVEARPWMDAYFVVDRTDGGLDRVQTSGFPDTTGP